MVRVLERGRGPRTSQGGSNVRQSIGMCVWRARHVLEGGAGGCRWLHAHVHAFIALGATHPMKYVCKYLYTNIFGLICASGWIHRDTSQFRILLPLPQVLEQVPQLDQPSAPKSKTKKSCLTSKASFEYKKFQHSLLLVTRAVRVAEPARNGAPCFREVLSIWISAGLEVVESCRVN